MSAAHVRSFLLRRRSLQRLVAAAAVVGLATALVTIEALASEAHDDAEVRTVRVAAADEVDLLAEDSRGLSGVLGEAVEARSQVVAVEAEPAPEPEPAREPEPEREPATPSEPEPGSAPAPQGSVDLATWNRLAECESGGNWSIDTGNGFYGGLQFELSSWEWVGGTGMPHEASKQEQIARAEILVERQGWEAWPACSRKLGLR